MGLYAIQRRYRNLFYLFIYLIIAVCILNIIRNSFSKPKVNVRTEEQQQQQEQGGKFFDFFFKHEKPEKLPRVFCMILSHPKNFPIQGKTINRTWAKHCDKHFFISKMESVTTNISLEFSDPLPILQPAFHNNETYGRLTDKIYKTIRDMYLRYNDYDWYLKCDDDSYIFVDNLKKFLSDKNSSSPVTYGYDFKVIVDHGYHSGGAGYVLSHEAMMRLGKQLDTNYTSCPNTGTEDVDVAKCLRKLGVYPNKSLDELGRERFHPLSLPNHYKGGYPDWMYGYSANNLTEGVTCCSDTSISFHYMNPEEIQLLYNIWTNMTMNSLPPYNFTAVMEKMVNKN